jgi:cytochrome c oxidase subunit 1
MLGRLMNPFWGKVHFWMTMVFYNMTFWPMHDIGAQGHMRRLYDPTQYDFLKPLQGVNEFISISAFLLFATQLIFAANFIMSWFKGEKAGRNPWNDTGLEWSTPSPAPHGNFEKTPTVYHQAYEFSHPQTQEDFLPQDKKLDTSRAPAGAGH